MIPQWVNDLDQYVTWLGSVVERIESLGGELHERDYLAISNEASVGTLAGIGDTTTIEVEQNRLVMPAGSFLEFSMIVQQTEFWDGRPTEILESKYSYHVESPRRFQHRYDCHDDHHDLGTRYHIHIGRGRRSQRETIRASAEMTLESVFEEMLDKGMVV